MRTAHFHEDDYCQIELVCDENLEWCLEQCRAIEKSSDAFRSGDAWTQMYVRPKNPVALATRAISMQTLSDAVSPILQPFDAVTTGYSTHVETMPRTRAFGIDRSVMLFAEERNGVVGAVWFLLYPSDDAEVAVAADALSALAELRLLLVDWGWTQVVLLADREGLDEYLRTRVQVFAELEEKFEQERNARAPTPAPPQRVSWLRRLLGAMFRSR